MTDLGVQPYHLTIIVAIEMHRWRPDSAWPSQQALADITGYSLKRVNEITTELNDMDLVKKIYRDGRACLYNFDPLVDQLEKIIGIPHASPIVVEV